MPCTEIRVVLLDTVRCVSELIRLGPTKGRWTMREHVATIVPGLNYPVKQPYLWHMSRERVNVSMSLSVCNLQLGRTISLIQRKHLLHQTYLLGPHGYSPTVGITFVFGVRVHQRTLWDILETPAPVVPYPINFRVPLQSRRCKR